MIKNDLILEDVMEVVLKDDKSWNPIRISLVCNELKKELTKKCVSYKGVYGEIDYVKPQEGKTYALTGGPKDKCIANGNTWKESEVKDNG